jgi:hypothetical protein
MVRRRASNSSRIYLDRSCHNAYNERIKPEGRGRKLQQQRRKGSKVVQHLVVAILVGRRIAGGG